MQIPLTERRAGQKKYPTVLLISVVLIVALLSSFLGYRYGISNSKIDRAPVAAVPNVTKAVSPAEAVAKPKEEDIDDLLNPSSEYYGLLEKNHLLQRGQKMATLFSSNPLGKALSQALTLIQFKGQLDTPEGKRVSERLTILEGQPSDALDEIRNGISNFEGELNSERQFLIQYVARLELDPTEKTDFLTKELLRNNDIADNKNDQVNAIVALTSLMKLDIDQNSIEAALKQILDAKVPYTTRITFISIYESKYPDQSQRIESEFGL